MNIPWISHEYPVNVPWISHEYPMNIPWISHEYPMNFPWISHEYPMNIPWISHEYPMNFPWISHEYPMNIPWISHEYPMNFPWISHEYPMNIPWISHEYPMNPAFSPPYRVPFFRVTFPATVLRVLFGLQLPQEIFSFQTREQLLCLWSSPLGDSWDMTIGGTPIHRGYPWSYYMGYTILMIWTIYSEYSFQWTNL